MAESGSSSAPEYFLTTPRVGFRLWTENDTGLASALWGDPEVSRFIDSRGALNAAEVKQKLNAELQSQVKYGIQYWPIFLKENGEHVGCCGVRPKDIGNGVMEFGVHLRRDYWGSGLAAEAGRAAIDFVFTYLDATELFAGHNPQNKASRHLLQKLGFVYIGDEFYPPTGLLHPSYTMRRPTVTTAIQELGE
jgi:RimJ/RimL family protein N-acetyltransferase